MAVIAEGESQRIIGVGNSRITIVRIIAGDVARLTREEGAAAETGDRFEIGEAFYIYPRETRKYILHAVNAPLEYELLASDYDNPDPEKEKIELLNRTKIVASRINRQGIVGDTITPGVGGDTFADVQVPDGFDVVVSNRASNADSVLIQDDDGNDIHELVPGSGITLGVSNLNQISITGTANNPTVSALVERL